MENQFSKKGRGRPLKKIYDSSSLMREMIDTAAEIYRATSELGATARELSLPPNKVKKLLITGNIIFYPETEQIQELLRQGKTMEEIRHEMGLSHSAINTYLPYTKGVYKMSEISQNAERVRRYQERKQALSDLAEHKTEENLWKCAEKKLRGPTIHPAAAGKSKPRFAASVPPKEHPHEKQQ